MLTRADLLAIRAIIREEVAAATRSGGPSMTGIGALVAPYVIKPSPAATGAYIYFLRCECATYPIKIGYARDVEVRITALQSGSPFRLELLACYWVLDFEAEEERLHKRFALLRIRGEWFSHCDEIEDLAKQIRAEHSRQLVGVLLDRSETA